MRNKNIKLSTIFVRLILSSVVLVPRLRAKFLANHLPRHISRDCEASPEMVFIPNSRHYIVGGTDAITRFICAIMFCCLPFAACAATYKCTQSNGSITYQGTPCMQDGASQEMLKIANSGSSSSTSSGSEWILVKTLVIPQKLPDNPNYVVTTETFLNKGSIVSAGGYMKAAFRQSAKDSTGYEMTYVKDKILMYYYDCKAGQIASASGRVPDSKDFMPFLKFIEVRPKLPFADASVVTLVCGSR
jgi:hypothetical protein